MSLKNDGNNIFKVVFSVTGVLLIAKLLGFVKQIVVANTFGATAETDIINLSQGLITDFEFILVQTMITALIPIYITVKEKSNSEDSKKFVSNVLKLFLVIALIISIIVFIFSPLISRIIAPSFSGPMAKSLTSNIRIYAFALVVYVFIAIFNALLKGHNLFLPSELVSVIQSLIFIVCIIALKDVLGVNTLILSFFLQLFVNALFLGICSRKYWKIYFDRIRIDDNIKKMLHMIAPLLLGYAMLYINQLVDKMLASGLGEGTVTSLSYSSVLVNFINSFIASICGIAFTYIAQNVAKEMHEGAASIIGYFTTFFVTLLIPISIITVYNAKDIITVVFGHGAFDINAVNNSSYALMGYGLSFIPYVIRELFNRLQYSYHDTRRPMINSIISIAVNICLSIVLSKFWGVFGITLASSISVMVCAISNVISSRKHNDKLRMASFKSSFFLWLIGGVLCFAVCYLFSHYISISNLIIKLVISCLSSIGIYCLVVSPIIIRVLKNRKRIIK